MCEHSFRLVKLVKLDSSHQLNTVPYHCRLVFWFTPVVASNHHLTVLQDVVKSATAIKYLYGYYVCGLRV